MIFGVCVGPSYEEAELFLSKIEDHVDGIELRLDRFEKVDLDALGYLLKNWKKKVLFTYPRVESESLYNIWEGLLGLRPDYVDLSLDCSDDLLHLVQDFPHPPKVILSYHNFIETKDIASILEAMTQRKADVYKIATYAQSSLDSLRMLELSVSAKKRGFAFIGICMGPLGLPTRILSPLVGNVITFVKYAGNESADGQIDLIDMDRLYRFNQLTPSTKIYALIGETIEQSISPLIHNYLFTKTQTDALYIKIVLQKGELEPFFTLFRSLFFFSGLSVTMPFKEGVLPFLDRWVCPFPYLRACNTIVKEGGELIGYNTDYRGAVKALENHLMLKEKRVVIIGSGATAKSIASACLDGGAKVAIAARSLDKKESWKEFVGVDYHLITDLEQLDYDVLINTTPVQMPVSKSIIRSSRFFMDVSYHPKESSFLSYAKSVGGTCIYGLDMLIHQALYQQGWFGMEHDHDTMYQQLSLAVASD
jgi:3-dehydroquinate dehydratase/shikimate dehydrogenase